jgi:hypothetical protein
MNEMSMNGAKTYEQLSSPRLERWHAEKRYRAKAEECFHLAANAYTRLEKQAWQELGDDWLSLANEVREVVTASSPPIGTENT